MRNFIGTGPFIVGYFDPETNELVKVLTQHATGLCSSPLSCAGNAAFPVRKIQKHQLPLIPECSSGLERRLINLRRFVDKFPNL